MKKVFIIFLIILIITVVACSSQVQSNTSKNLQEIVPSKESSKSQEDISPQSQTKDTTVQSVKEEQTKEFFIEIGHTFYSPNKFTVKKGDTVKFFAFSSTGTSSHNHGITIDEYGIDQAVTNTERNNPTIIKFVADKAGTFKIWCKSCWEGRFGRGHPDITATLIVEE